MTPEHTDDHDTATPVRAGTGYPAHSERASAKADAPDPDHPSKPDSPTDLTKPSWMYVLRKTFREFLRDQVPDMAAALTYWAVLAVAPAVIALISVLGLFGNGQQIVADVIDEAETISGMQLEAWRI